MITQHAQMQPDAMRAGIERNLAKALADARAPLLFAFRLWASVCLALFVAFWLQLDNPYWAGTSAVVVCQPRLGAALRKGWFRMIGTVIGAVAIVALTACFPQDRIAFFALLALWGGLCAFAATVLHNFASYAAALAGYTAAIVGADVLGATGGASSEVFMLAIFRASEICIGIVCAGVVLAGTDFGGAQRRLALSLVNLAADIARGFTRMLADVKPRLSDTRAEQRELLRRVIALEPIIDEALGESSYLAYRSATLQAAVDGLLAALVGWNTIAAPSRRARASADRHAMEAILAGIPAELRSAGEPNTPELWMANPTRPRIACDEGERALLAVTTAAPACRLFADETATVLNGIARVLDGLALLVDAPRRRPTGTRNVSPTIPDWLPAAVNAIRAFVAIGAVELLWVATAWPNGGLAVVFVTIQVLLLSPRGDLAYLGALAFSVTAAVGIVAAAIMKFAVLPAAETFPALCAAMGLFLMPIGFAVIRSRSPALVAMSGGMAVAVMRLLSPTNPMTYDMAQFYNTALAIFVGCGIGPLAFRLLPPLSPALRTRRLLARTLRDLRRLAVSALPPQSADWERRMYDRLAALPDQAPQSQRERLLAALSVGIDIIHVRRLIPRVGKATELDAALVFLADANSTAATARLYELNRCLASDLNIEQEADDALRLRGRIIAISEVLAEHGSYFDSRIMT